MQNSAPSNTPDGAAPTSPPGQTIPAAPQPQNGVGVRADFLPMHTVAPLGRWQGPTLEAATLAALLGIPPGPLPALAGEAGAACALGGLLLGACAFAPALRRTAMGAVLLLLAAMGVCALWARQAGVPGDLWTLDTYAALPLPALAQGWACAGLLLVALGSLWSIWRVVDACPAPARYGLRRRLWLWAALGVWISLFWPGGLSPLMRMPFMPGLALDVLYFFAKLYCLSLVLTYARRARVCC